MIPYGVRRIFMYEPDQMVRTAAERYFRNFEFQIDRSCQRRGLVAVAKGRKVTLDHETIKVDAFYAAAAPTDDMVELLEAMPTAVVVDASSARFVCERMKAFEFTSVTVLITYGAGSDEYKIADTLVRERLADASIAKPLQIDQLVGIVVIREILANM